LALARGADSGERGREDLVDRSAEGTCKGTRPATGAMGPAPIDHGYFARFTRGNAAFEREVLALFCAELPARLVHLREAASAEAWRDAAHTITGGAMAVGAWRLARAAEAAERSDVEGAADRQRTRAEAHAAVAAAAEDVWRYVAGLARG